MTRTFVCICFVSMNSTGGMTMEGNMKKRTKKVTAVIEKWDDGTVSAYVPDFEGFNLNGQGTDVDGAKKALQEAVSDYRYMFEARGEELPEQLKEVEFEYRYDIATFFDSFRFISVSSFAKYAGINPSLMRQYKQRLSFASEAQKEKIESAIHRAGKEMMAVRL